VTFIRLRQMHGAQAAGICGEPRCGLPQLAVGKPLGAAQPDDERRVDQGHRTVEAELDAVAARFLGARQVAPERRREYSRCSGLRLLPQHHLMPEELLDGGDHQQPLLVLVADALAVRHREANCVYVRLEHSSQPVRLRPRGIDDRPCVDVE